VTALPVTVFVVLDGLGVGFGGGVTADALGAMAAALVGVVSDGCGELAGTELAGAELAGVDESGTAEAPGVEPESATGRGALAGVVLKLSRTTSPVTVATKTEPKRRMTQPPLKLRNDLEFE